MPAWPASLPQTVETRGYVRQFGNNAIRSEAEGAQKQRRRFTYVPDVAQVTMLMTEAQKVAFETFWKVDCGYGVSRITGFPHPDIPGAIRDARFFANEPPSIAPVEEAPANFYVSFKVEIYAT